MQPKITRDTVKRLKRMRKTVTERRDTKVSVYDAWMLHKNDRLQYADDCPVRFALRRHMIPSETPIGMRQLLDQQWLPISHSVAWLDTVIDYAERELRGEV